MTTTLISFYTVDGHYDQHALRLRDECTRLGVPHRVEPLKDTGSYLGNCRMKPRFILDTLVSVGAPVLWVDVDASVLGLPMVCAEYQRDQIDFAARPVEQKGRVRKWHVGTMWFNHTIRTLEFLRAWCETSGITDEAALHKLEQAGGMERLKTCALPQEYFWIGNGLPPHGTVIQHRLSGHKRKKDEYMLAVEDERRNG